MIQHWLILWLWKIIGKIHKIVPVYCFFHRPVKGWLKFVSNSFIQMNRLYQPVDNAVYVKISCVFSSADHKDEWILQSQKLHKLASKNWNGLTRGFDFSIQKIGLSVIINTNQYDAITSCHGEKTHNLNTHSKKQRKAKPVSIDWAAKRQKFKKQL